MDSFPAGDTVFFRVNLGDGNSSSNNANSLAEGMYFVRLEVNDRLVIQKFAVKRGAISFSKPNGISKEGESFDIGPIIRVKDDCIF